MTETEAFHPGTEEDQAHAPEAVMPETTDAREETLTRAEVDKIIADRLRQRDEEHARETARLRANVPQLVVPQHGGGPGNDNHQVSWNLAEQEAAARGERLDHWHLDD